jgi:hypothetical protein
MIRWEEREDGDWYGFSGELLVAAAVRPLGGSSARRWEWEVSGVTRPAGWRNSGHRSTAIAARRSADEYWKRWLEAAALRPDVERLAELSPG